MAHSLHPQLSSLLQQDKLVEVKELQRLLYLFHHRNKNQHRRSIWWRSFANFRRELGCLLDEADGWMAATADLSKGTWPKGAKGLKARMALAEKNAARKPQLELKMERRLSWWADSLVEKWWIAFTHILTLNQFTQLGIFLVAALARFSHLTGLTAALEQLADAETQALITRFANEEASEIFAASGIMDEDVGELVQRRVDNALENSRDPATVLLSPEEKASVTAQGISQSKTGPQEKRRSSPSNRKRQAISSWKQGSEKKKKRKPGNAIDDLFSGVL